MRIGGSHRGQSPEDLRRLAMSAPHARTRERALALYEIAQGSCATRVAGRTGRHPQTVMGWVHAYNAQGPDALGFRRTGGRPPLYGAHYVKRYLLRANAVCWTKSGPASLLSGRRLAAPPCIRSALEGVLTNIPRSWAKARPGERDPSVREVRVNPASGPPLCRERLGGHQADAAGAQDRQRSASEDRGLPASPAGEACGRPAGPCVAPAWDHT